MTGDPAIAEIRTILRDLLPTAAAPLNLHEPEIAEHEKARVMEALDEGYVSYAGRHVGLFETALAERCGVADAVAIVSGTAAIHSILFALGIGAGDEVLCPSLTFVATANAIIHAGATPNFVDSDAAHLGIDPDRLDAYLARIARRADGRVVNTRTGRRIAAVMPVYVFGHIGALEALKAVADKWGLPLVEDATEALGSRAEAGPIGGVGVAAALSFNGNKIVTTGGGGAVLTNDRALAEHLKHLTTTAKRPHPWRFDHDAVAFNYRMPNLNAALGLAQVERLDDFVDRKRRLAAAYAAAFASARHWRFVTEPAGCRSNYWLNAVLLASPDIDRLEAAIAALHRDGYRCRPSWTPMHQLPIHADHPRDELPVAEALAASVLSLPSSPILVERLA